MPLLPGCEIITPHVRVSSARDSCRQGGQVSVPETPQNRPCSNFSSIQSLDVYSSKSAMSGFLFANQTHGRFQFLWLLSKLHICKNNQRLGTAFSFHPCVTEKQQCKFGSRTMKLSSFTGAH